MDPGQLCLLTRYLTEYRHQGYELGERKFMELTVTWVKKLAAANRDYNFRFSSSTKKFRSNITDPNVVRDFPVDVLKTMALDR